MTAEQIFTELGHRCFKYANNTFYEHETKVSLEFDKTRKELLVFSGERTVVELNQKQLLAITKQMEELGWLDD